MLNSRLFDSKYKSSHCHYFLRGYCKEGNRCRFYHEGVDEYQALINNGYHPPEKVKEVAETEEEPVWVTVVSKYRHKSKKEHPEIAIVTPMEDQLPERSPP